MSKVQLKKFFSEYAFVNDVIGDDNFYDLPERVNPARFEVKPFSHEELSVIGAYAGHHMEME